MVRLILLVLLWMLLCILYLLAGAGIAYLIRPDNAIASMAIIYLWPVIAPILLIMNLYRKIFRR